MNYLKDGDKTYQVNGSLKILLDSDDNFDVSEDGSTLTPKPHKLLSKLQFRCRFTTSELIGIDNCAQSTALSADQKAAMLTIMTNFAAATQIDLYDSRILEGVDYIESTGLIASGRAAEILKLS